MDADEFPRDLDEGLASLIEEAVKYFKGHYGSIMAWVKAKTAEYMIKSKRERGM